MHESDPKSIRDQEGIQRDEDMALNTFALGCEIVKDKKVFKSIGFVDFDFYHSPPKRKPALAPIKNSCLYLCPACGFSELRRSAEKLASCPVCSGHGLKAFDNVSAPLGYLAGKEPKDFNGNYEWTPNKTETHIDNEASKIELRQAAGANLLLGNNKAPRQGMARAINTNLGKCFNVAKSKTRADPAEYCLDALSASEAFERKTCDESTARNVVLVSTKVAGVLEIALADTNAALNLTPDFSAFSSISLQMSRKLLLARSRYFLLKACVQRGKPCIHKAAACLSVRQAALPANRLAHPRLARPLLPFLAAPSLHVAHLLHANLAPAHLVRDGERCPRARKEVHHKVAFIGGYFDYALQQGFGLRCRENLALWAFSLCAGKQEV